MKGKREGGGGERGREGDKGKEGRKGRREGTGKRGGEEGEKEGWEVCSEKLRGAISCGNLHSKCH